jgi:hypothetical protein
MSPWPFVSLIAVFQLSTYHRLHQLDAIVLWGVVRRRDHNADVFAVQLARPQSCNETNAGQDRIEDIAAAISWERLGIFESRSVA